MQYERILVMGIGNTLMADEGVGPAVIERLLAEYDFPAEVTVNDSGTMGMAVLDLFSQYDYIIVVDAVDGTGEAPGTVMAIAPEDIADNTVLHSAHDMRFVDTLQNAALIGWEPDAIVVGIQILDMNPAELTMDLTPPVEAAVPIAVGAVIDLLNEAGVHPVRKG